MPARYQCTGVGTGLTGGDHTDRLQRVQPAALARTAGAAGASAPAVTAPGPIPILLIRLPDGSLITPDHDS